MSSYPRFIMFKDINDPKTVTEVITRNVDSSKPITIYSLKENRTEELFGEGVKLKGITVEMTEDSFSCGGVDSHMPLNYEDVIIKGWRELSFESRKKIYGMTGFKLGECR